MGIQPGDRVLEVGVGTGINAALYPRDCTVTGIDLSGSMLEKARERVARKGIRNVRLLEMDAADLKFADDTLRHRLRAVPDQRRARSRSRSRARCAASAGPAAASSSSITSAARTALLAWIERAISPFTVHIGFKSDLDLPAFLAQADLKPVSIEKVNVPRIWSLVTCVKEPSAGCSAFSHSERSARSGLIRTARRAGRIAAPAAMSRNRSPPRSSSADRAQKPRRADDRPSAPR